MDNRRFRATHLRAAFPLTPTSPSPDRGERATRRSLLPTGLTSTSGHRSKGTVEPRIRNRSSQDVLTSGCIGLATLTIAGQFKPRIPSTGAVLQYPIPDVRNGFSSFADAVKFRDKQNRNSPLKSEGTTISGNAPRWRIFALLYSSKNETYTTAEPTKAADGSFDLSSNNLLLTIADRSKPGTTLRLFHLLRVGRPVVQCRPAVASRKPRRREDEPVGDRYKGYRTGKSAQQQ